MDAAALRAGLECLAARDRDLEAALARMGQPPPRQRPPGFATLLRIMTAQQLSTRAAAAIWGRLEAACAPAVTPQRVLTLDEPQLRAAGLSRRKTEHARALAQAVVTGALDLETLALRPEEEAIGAISALPGFGRWSAEIYLLFALGRADVFPAGDLALQIGIQRLKRLDRRPDPALTRRLAEPWRPHRGCAAIFLWHYYGSATLEDAPAASARSGAGR